MFIQIASELDHNFSKAVFLGNGFFLLQLIVKIVTIKTGHTSPLSMSNETYQIHQGGE